MSRFPTTIWTVIREAGTGRATAQGDLVGRYRPAVVAFARLKGVDAAEAEDVAQEVFLRVFDDGLLRRADRVKGRFRSLVIAVTKHVLGHHFERKAAQKRGGGAKPLSLDAALDEATAHARDDDFDREWLALLLGRALAKLRSENETWYACLHAFIVEEKSQRDVGVALGKTESSVRNAVLRGKERLAAIVRDEIATYASSDGEFEDEVRYLQRLLDGAAGPT